VIPVATERGKEVALFGLGGSGMATALALVAGGARVTAFDDNPARVTEAAAKGIPTGDLRAIGMSGFSELVLSPGVPLTHPAPHWAAALANRAGVAIVGDIELFCRERRAARAGSGFVAITGTNGKSTTTALIAHVLGSAGRDAQMGGNIGRAILSLEPPADGRVHVVECSSYQIDLAPSLDPDVGILLNLTPDHIDRHGTMANYAAIKSRLVEASATAVIGVDDEACRAIADRCEAAGGKVVRISNTLRPAGGIWLAEGKLWRGNDGGETELFDLAQAPALRGDHNAQNAAAAWAACEALGLAAGEIAAGMRSFPGLAHRMEQVGRAGRVLFVNDSKATNADAAGRALSSFERIYWIAGGLPKEGGIAPLSGYFGRIAKAYLIGEAAPQFAATLGGAAPFEIAGTLDVAVARAAADATADHTAGFEPVVLLSPACASFDQFANFEKRGDAFRAAVLALPGIAPLAGRKSP
jgi:UDP-N-acetylmuramoylalanine--D-glutamate ligase